MKLSVVVVVRNDPRIHNCIKAIMNQSLLQDEYEIIVVDNASTDTTADIIKQFPVKYIREEKVGMCLARNKGIASSNNEVVVFTDADCMPSHNWLKELSCAFDDYNIGGAGGVIMKLDEDGNIAQAARDLVVGQQKVAQYLPMYPDQYIVTANAAYRRNVLIEIGCFDSQFFSGGDVDIAWRVQMAGYKINLVNGAIVFHASRSSPRAYFRQFYKYGLGHALLFKKFRKFTNKWGLINKYPFVELARLAFIRAPSLLFNNLLNGFDKIRWLRLGLDLIEYVALICGDIIGAIRYRVPYL